MEKPKHKVNAKKFLEDYRAGKSEAELMQSHGLNRVTLEKLYNLLIEKKLLDRSELRPARIDARGPNPEPPRITQSVPPPEPEGPRVGVYDKALHYDSTECPQCGAAVTKKSLTCPECGHVLPGEERWTDVEPKKRLWDRIPPKVLGCIIALPIAVAFFFLFKDVILPMSESAISKRADALRKETKGAAPLKIAKDMAQVGSSNIIRFEVERLVAEEILARAGEDYTVFVAGTRWDELSHEAKLAQLSGIRQALKNSAMRPDFELTSESGQTLARAHGVHIEVMEQTAQPGMIPDPTASYRPEAPPPTDPGAVERAVERRLPAGLDRKFPNRGF